MNKLRKISITVVALMALGASIASGESNTATDEDGKEVQEAAVGELVNLGDWAVQVHGVTDPYVATNEFMTPQPGNRFVVVDTEVTNNGDAPEIVSSIACFDLRDAENKNYDITITGDSSSTLDGEVAPGSGLRGNLEFEVPEAATGLQLHFKCDVFGSGSAVISLS
ncbi:MAG: DUF4352 domain-containing protein [Aeromicrobium sp.]|uniref:DUF4352 domain-containing protein n=1 Tax=Aeromicrobium sp. TaxID=1871063 RepID=UPI0039E6CEB7